MAKAKDNIKEIAQILFLQNKLSQKEIAEKLDVAPQTLTRWAKAFIFLGTLILRKNYHFCRFLLKKNTLRTLLVQKVYHTGKFFVYI